MDEMRWTFFEFRIIKEAERKNTKDGEVEIVRRREWENLWRRISWFHAKTFSASDFLRERQRVEMKLRNENSIHRLRSHDEKWRWEECNNNASKKIRIPIKYPRSPAYSVDSSYTIESQWISLFMHIWTQKRNQRKVLIKFERKIHQNCGDILKFSFRLQNLQFNTLSEVLNRVE